jgi:hypothetical protein
MKYVPDSPSDEERGRGRRDEQRRPHGRCDSHRADRIDVRAFVNRRATTVYPMQNGIIFGL